MRTVKGMGNLMLSRLNNQIGRLPKILLLFFSLVLAVSIAFCDYKIKEDISFYVFYSIPIFIASWFVGGLAGIFISFASSLAWGLVDFTRNESHQLILYLDSLLRLIFFTAMSLVISYLRKAFEREKNSAHTDFLTGLPNRRTFIERFSTEIERAKRYNRALTIAYIDLDNFKMLNDHYGHAVGDEALQKIAARLREDIRKSDFVARMGGDEFLLYLPETNGTQAMSSLKHLQNSLNEVTKTHALPITFSIGAITYAIPKSSAEEMIKTADRIMYSAKSAGKNMIKHINA
jgi:diguanylate cyclase (GGDEF)-like protein